GIRRGRIRRLASRSSGPQPRAAASRFSMLGCPWPGPLSLVVRRRSECEESFMRSRRAFAQAAVWGLGCLLLTSGCQPNLSPRSEWLIYPNGVTLFSRGGVCSSVQWQNDNPGPCPLVLHLPAGDLGARELADPQVLQARGWVQGFRDPARGTAEYKWEVLD